MKATRVIVIALLLVAVLGSAVHAESKPVWSIFINIPEFRLYLFRDGQLDRTYPIAAGKPSTPTPVGQFRILNKQKNPTWYPPDGAKPVPPGPSNPLGPWWMGVTRNGVGLHGGGNNQTIGTAVSHGCMRMYNQHATELALTVPVGTPVTIAYNLIRPVPSEQGWQLEVYRNIYRRQFPNAEAIAQSFEQYGFNEMTDWDLVAALTNGAPAGRYLVPVRVPLIVGELEFDAFMTPERVWIRNEVLWGLVWLSGVATGRYWHTAEYDVRQVSVGTGATRFVTIDALKGLLGDQVEVTVQNSPAAVVLSWPMLQTVAAPSSEQVNQGGD